MAFHFERVKRGPVNLVKPFRRKQESMYLGASRTPASPGVERTDGLVRHPPEASMARCEPAEFTVRNRSEESNRVEPLSESA
ncbi:MAG TPA: hypothetical protein DCE18_07970 [Syntrophobacteraceae bacterium]|nr:hypothetical protein [Syntrophobacteraceae bacterium]